MKYVVTNFNCIGGVYSDSEPMDYSDALEVYHEIELQARRGFREFPDLVDSNGNIIM